MTRDLVSRRIVEAGLRFLEREDARRANLRPIDRGDKTALEVDDPARVGVREKRLGRDGDVFALARLRGQSDLLPVAWLERGRLAARAVARIAVRDRYGADQGFANGFLIGERLLLTCAHVLTSAESAERSLAEFGAEVDGEGRPLSPQIFALEPDALFIRDENLDIALVAIAQHSFADASLEAFGRLALDPESGKVLLSERLTLIDHPSGLGKHMGMRTARLVDAFGPYFHYAADFEPAGSGAPVFNDQWEVVALHRGGIPKMDAKKRVLDVNGRSLEPGGVAGWSGGEGTRISRICDFLATYEPSGEKEAALLAGLGLDFSTDTEIVSEPPVISETWEEPVFSGLLDEPVLEGTHEEEVAEEEPPLSGLMDEAIEEPAPEAEAEAETEAVAETEAEVVDPPETPESSVHAVESTNYEPEDADGYDSDFLSDDQPVYMPILAPEWSHALLRDELGSSETRGRRLSVAYDRQRHAPLIAAANLDGHTWEMPDEENGALLIDSRFSSDDQASITAFQRDGLVRLPLIDARTLCCGFGAQESGREADWLLNQILLQKRDGLEIWHTVSLHWVKWVVSQQSRANVYAGPVLSPGEDLDCEGAMVAGELWKVVAWMEGEELRSAGYLLTTRNVLRSLDGAPGSWRMYRVSLSHLQDLTGMDFGILRRADDLFERPTEHLPILSKADLTEPSF